MGNPFILVEAAQRSGAMNTTRIALNAGKKIYVVPHHPLCPNNEGCLNLLLDGACPSSTTIIEPPPISPSIQG